MKNTLLLMFFLLSQTVNSYPGEPRSATLDALSSAMDRGDLQAADLSKVFDGGISYSIVPVVAHAAAGVTPTAPMRTYRPFSLPVPLPALEDKIVTAHDI